MKITKVQVFTYQALNEHEDDTYSANIFTSEGFVLQIGIDGEFSIPFGHECTCTTEEAQDKATDELDADNVAEELGLESGISSEDLENIALSQGASIE